VGGEGGKKPVGGEFGLGKVAGLNKVGGLGSIGGLGKVGGAGKKGIGVKWLIWDPANDGAMPNGGRFPVAGCPPTGKNGKAPEFGTMGWPATPHGGSEPLAGVPPTGRKGLAPLFATAGMPKVPNGEPDGRLRDAICVIRGLKGSPTEFPRQSWPYPRVPAPIGEYGMLAARPWGRPEDDDESSGKNGLCPAIGVEAPRTPDGTLETRLEGVLCASQGVAVWPEEEPCVCCPVECWSPS